ncbi:MexH family multidrug efflux RND transporter periplasmic adaptor subunit [Deltaproteobacteria bacterium]|nr:MexH family multidrug efflux RND transporter periplasmic adaptor subunit [Deltaproteobacteria bacterium]
MRALDSAELRPEVAGLVESVEFADGAQVTRGDVLVHLRSADAEATRLDARSRAVVATQELDRAKALFTKGEFAQAELDRAEANDGLARAAVARADEAVRRTTIRAPFDGVVGKRQVSPGELVDPSRVVTRLDGLGSLRVDLSLPETDLSRVSPGLAVQVTATAAPGAPIPGTVAFVASHIDEATRTFEVRVAVQDPESRLRPGMTATVKIVASQAEQALLVPTECVVPTAAGSAVWVVTAENKVNRRPVTLGERHEARVEVTAGLAPGDRIVSEGLARLREGASVEVLSPPAAPDAPPAAAPPKAP